jgi:hypothetical protein
MVQPVAITFEDFAIHIATKLGVRPSGKSAVFDPKSMATANLFLFGNSGHQDRRTSMGPRLLELLPSVSCFLCLPTWCWLCRKSTYLEYRRPGFVVDFQGVRYCLGLPISIINKGCTLGRLFDVAGRSTKDVTLSFLSLVRTYTQYYVHSELYAMRGECSLVRSA